MKPIIAALLINNSPIEVPIISKVAIEYKLNDEQTALLVAIRLTENGRPGCEFGIERPIAMRFADDFPKSIRIQAMWCAGTIKRHYAGDLTAFAQRYCPVNWQVWKKNVQYFMNRVNDENPSKTKI